MSKSPGFWNNSKINGQFKETHVGFSDTCGNGLINLSFVPKSKSFFDHGRQSVSFSNFLPQSSFRGPSSRPVVLQKIMLQIVCVCVWGGGGGGGHGMFWLKPPCFQTPKVGMSVNVMEVRGLIQLCQLKYKKCLI